MPQRRQCAARLSSRQLSVQFSWSVCANAPNYFVIRWLNLAVSSERRFGMQLCVSNSHHRHRIITITSHGTPVPKPCRVFDANTVCHGYRAFIWVPNNYKKAISKHLTQGLPKYWPQVPQISPKGPKFLVEIFSHTTLKWCVFMIFFDLLAKKGTLFIESGDKMGKRAH